MRVQADVWRYIPRGTHPLHVGFLLHADGRWNRFGEYGCLYTAMTRAGAVAEYARMLSRAGLVAAEDAERDLVTIVVDVRPVLDLTDRRTRRGLGVSLGLPTGDSETNLEACRTVADFARAQGIKGIREPLNY